MDWFDDVAEKESFYAECQRAALYRVYLFAVMKKDSYLIEKLGGLLHRVDQGAHLEEFTAGIQDSITMAKYLYGARLESGILDYALEKSIIDENEDELVRLALNESLRRSNMVSLEACICPKNTSQLLYRTLKNYEHIVDKRGETDQEETDQEGRDCCYDKLIYVFHFPKLMDGPFVAGAPRNEKVRRNSARQAKAITALLERHMEINEHIRGIDACSSEIACRPEVFAQVFRYLSDVVIVCKETRRHKMQTRYKTRRLHSTYHAGEDFFDIVDGLRAIDESILFCGLRRGSRLGHALALGIAPEEYYRLKGFKLVLAKQIVLDDVVWMLCKADEFGCQINSALRKQLEEKFYYLYEEIYGNCLGNGYRPSLYDYYQSWKLRGDKPELYRLDAEIFIKKLYGTELQKFDRYQFNDRVRNNLRENAIYRELYHAYHFDETVRKKGSVVTEVKVEENYSNLVRQLQDKMIGRLACMGIGIETNPSSNYLIGTIKKYDEHPILRFNSRKLGVTEQNMSLSVSINTDDQGVFDTLLENEYALMALALKKSRNKDAELMYDLEDIYEWVNYVRQMGIEQVFS